MTAPTASSEEQKFEQIVQQLAPQSHLLQTWPLKGGISATMTALTFARPDGQTSRVIVRRPSASTLQRNPQAAQAEFRLLQITHALGLATPKPYYLDTSGTLFATPYLVIEYVEGKPVFAPADVADYVAQFATHLANIHRVDVTQQDFAFLPQHSQGFAEKLDTQMTPLNQALAEGHLRAALAPVWPLPVRNAATLLHGDFWPGNVLWRAGKLVAVVDWEDANIGDPLIDLAISRLDIACIFGHEAMQQFTQHYQARRTIDDGQLPYWDLWAALRFVRLTGGDLAEWAAFYPPFGRPDITAQTLYDNYWLFIKQAFAKLTVQ